MTTYQAHQDIAQEITNRHPRILLRYAQGQINNTTTYTVRKANVRTISGELIDEFIGWLKITDTEALCCHVVETCVKTNEYRTTIQLSDPNLFPKIIEAYK